MSLPQWPALRLALPRVMLVALLLAPPAALAGAQKYEPLSASVHGALSRSVSDRAPQHSSFEDSTVATDWLAAM